MPVNILVVDDEPDLQLLLRQAFRKKAEWQFVFAGDGVEALELLDAGMAVDLVLTDVNMPRMDGLALLKHLHTRDPLLRVVIVSAYGDMANIRTAMNGGAYDFVTKPINLADLEATIRKTWDEVQAGRAAERTRHELAVAREVQEAKARFFADLSHEFRTPLTLILGPLQDALAHGTVPPDEVPAMHRHALRLRRLIDQLLDLSKLDAGRMTLRAGRHDVLTFLRALVQSFVPAADRRSITLRLDAPEETQTLPLYFEPDKLEKIVANLLSNALKFTPAGGAVRVRVQATDADVVVAVRDSGPGIAPEAQAHLFDRFYQAGGRDGGGETGTGIGLALAKALTELHGGRITVDSEEGFGATFTVGLPRGRDHLHTEDVTETADDDAWSFDGVPLPPAMDDAEDDEPAPSAEAPLVLVVEDDADMRAYLRRRLQRRYRVVEAADGVEALEKARAETPALVVSDVMMPGMDGFALCRALKADEALRTVPVILLTARAEDDDVLAGLETGADDYLTKPFDARELLLRAENLIEVRRLLRDRYSDEVVLQPANVAVPSADAAFVERVRTYVDAHMGDRDFDVASVADAVGISPRQLRRRLRDVTGLSPSGFVRSMRLQRAAQLLQRQAGTISEIAYTVGYDDARHFARRFRQVYGALPSEYVKREA